MSDTAVNESLAVVDNDDDADATPKNYIIKAEIKRLIKRHDHQTAGDFMEGLNALVGDLVESAIARAQANHRKQVRCCDL